MKLTGTVPYRTGDIRLETPGKPETIEIVLAAKPYLAKFSSKLSERTDRQARKTAEKNTQ